MKLNITIGSWWPRRATIRDLGIEELRRTRIGLDNEERRIERDIEKKRADDGKLVSEYGAAKADGNCQQMRIQARRLQDLRERVKNLDQQHATVVRQMRVVNGLVLIKENEAFLRRIGENGRLDSIDLGQLQAYVEEATLEGELTRDRLTMLVETMNDACASSDPDGEDLAEFMASLDAEVEGRPLPSTNGDLDDAIAAVERELGNTQPAPSRDATRGA